MVPLRVGHLGQSSMLVIVQLTIVTALPTLHGDCHRPSRVTVRALNWHRAWCIILDHSSVKLMWCPALCAFGDVFIPFKDAYDVWVIAWPQSSSLGYLDRQPSL